MNHKAVCERYRAYCYVPLLSLGACKGETTYEKQYVDVSSDNGGVEGNRSADDAGTGHGGSAATDDSSASSSTTRESSGEASGADGTGGNAGRSPSDASTIGAGGTATGAAGAVNGADFTQTADLGNYLYVKASNPDAQDEFGSVVALADHWAVVSAPNESSRATGLNGDETDDSEDDSGAVYVFSDATGRWSQVMYLKAPNAGSGDRFGDSLAFDGTTLAVGAPGEDGSSVDSALDNDVANAGAVYVYERTGDSVSEPTYLKASTVSHVMQFGSSVGVLGSTLAVGAVGEANSGIGADSDLRDDAADYSGAVYVFERSEDEWSEITYLKASNTGSWDKFGAALAMDATTLAVGAPGEGSASGGADADQANDDAPEAGAVYVFEATANGWRQSAYLKPSNPQPDAHFGASLALQDDLLVVGAPSEGEAIDGDPVGAVYIFERSSAAWVERARLSPQAAITPAYYGWSLALERDALAVTAWGDYGRDGRLPYSGAVFMYRRSGTGWNEESYAVAPHAETNDRFGASVAMTPSLIAVGTIGEGSSVGGINSDPLDNRTPFAGALFLFAR